MIGRVSPTVNRNVVKIVLALLGLVPNQRKGFGALLGAMRVRTPSPLRMPGQARTFAFTNDWTRLANGKSERRENRIGVVGPCAQPTQKVWCTIRRNARYDAKPVANAGSSPDIRLY